MSIRRPGPDLVNIAGQMRSRSLLTGSALLVGLLAMAAPPPAFADQPTPALAGEKSSIKPVAERKLGPRKRPTVERRAEKDARRERATRVSLQIPERLRATLARKIDQRISRNIVQAKKLRGEAIGLLEKFVAESPKDAPALPEALMRLGELRFEQERDRFLTDFKRWESSPSDQRGAPPSADYSVARKLFLKVLREYKTYPDYDLALYVDGFLASEEGKHLQARGRFDKILKWFPGSRFVPDAHMIRAEYEFTKDVPNYQTALREYEQVLKYPDSGLRDLALFKSAWTLWRLGRSKEAARRFLTVFKATAEAAEKGRGSRAEIDELQREALRNLVTVFAEDEKNTAEDMHRFLVDAGGAKFAGRIVHALAEAFYDQAHFERGIEAYRLLLKLEPTEPDAYTHALKIAQGHSTMESWETLRKDYQWILREFVPDTKQQAQGQQAASAWASVQTSKTLTEAELAVEKQLRDDAVGLHAKAQADETSRGEYEATAKLYEVYLSRFGETEHAYEINYNLAEIYFYHLDDAVKAAEAYMAAVRMKPKGKLSRDALYNALAALEQARAAEFEKQKKAGEAPSETPTDKQLTEAMELYVETYPDDEDVPELLFRQGKLYYDYGVYDPAVRQWGLLVEKYPKSQYTVGAGELILDSFNKSEDYDNIETWARRLKKAPAFSEPKHQAKLDTLIVQAVFKQGEQHSQSGHHDKAAAAYLRAAREFPKEPRAAQAAVNAEVEARRAADLETLKSAVSLLVSDHKQREEAPKGVWIAATTYQSVGLLSEAANYHDLIVVNWPKSEHHEDAAFNAVLLRTTVGEHQKAIESGERFKKHYPRADEADEVTFLMGKAHEKAKKWKDAETLYARYAKTARSNSSRLEALVRLATVRVELDDERGAERALGQAMKLYKRHKRRLTDQGKYFAAKARYMQGERILADFEKVKIEGDVKQLKARLKRKSALLKKAADAFLDTAKMGVAEWTTAALYQIGFTYESFSRALLDSPPPDGLSAADKDLYVQQIDEFVIPIEERAIEAYETGWLEAKDLGIFNSWTAKMREALGRLTSEMYPPLKEIGFQLRSKAPTSLPPLIDGPRRSKKGRAQEYLMPASRPADPDQDKGNTGGGDADGKATKPSDAKPSAATPKKGDKP